MNDKPAMANTQAFAVITQDELSSLRAELAELRARVSGVPRTSEYYFAMRDAHLAHDSKAYFAARNDNLDTRENRQFFEAGFTRGFAAGEKVYAGTIASVPDDVAKDAEVGAAIHRACCELPEGFTIHIDLENGAGSVEMMWEDERWEPDFDLSFAGQISECVDEAIRSTDEDAAILAADTEGRSHG